MSLSSVTVYKVIRCKFPTLEVIPWICLWYIFRLLGKISFYLYSVEVKKPKTYRIIKSYCQHIDKKTNTGISNIVRPSITYCRITHFIFVLIQACVSVSHHNVNFYSSILNQNYNTTRKCLDFCMTMWCRTIYLRYVAQLLANNLWCTLNNVSTTRLSEH